MVCISLAIERSDLGILLEMVSSQVVNMLTVDVVDKWVFASLAVADLKSLLSLHKTCITHSSQSKNTVSDYLANLARTEKRTIVWFVPELMQSRL